jgi:hypothetical protein
MTSSAFGRSAFFGIQPDFRSSPVLDATDGLDTVRPTLLSSRQAEAIAYYDTLLTTKHLSSTREVLSETTERHRLYFEGRPYCTVLRPYIIDAAVRERAYRAATLVRSAVNTAISRLLADPALAKTAGIPEYMEPFLALDRTHGSQPIIARLDGFFGPSGDIKFIELNTRPGDFVEAEEISVGFSNLPIAREFAERYPFTTPLVTETMLEALYTAHEHRGGRGAPTIAQVRNNLKQENEASRRLGYAAWRGCQVIRASLEEFRCRDGELFVEDVRVHIVEAAWHLLRDLVLGGRDAAGKAVLDAFRCGKAHSFCGLSRDYLFSTKLLFDLLSDTSNASLFEREVAVAVHEHIPWTRRIRECRTGFKGETSDLLSIVQRYREQLVLKPAGGYGGEGVILGWECDQSAWDKAIQVALVRPYVVQERVPTVTHSFPAVVDGRLEMVNRLVDFNPYIWNGEHVWGHFLRSAAGGLLNLHAGGGSLLAGWTLT